MIDYVLLYVYDLLEDAIAEMKQVPNRLNYVLWIQSLLDTTSDNFNDSYDALHEVIGVDIGTGASCIYPLLGCASRSKWKFIGTGMYTLSLGWPV